MLFWLWVTPTAATVINVLTSWFKHGTDTGSSCPPSGTLHTIARDHRGPSTHLIHGIRQPRPGHFATAFIGDIHRSPSIR
ncbi:hypothetical protein GA0115254_111797 [Streptomyces sp. Ncost-T10-10d]|nr:hypothetical protein GA0115254_111797 [Streptomyces sp. Ncost-T10-10d]